MEVAVGFCIVYGSVLIDAYLMSFCWIISAQYQSVTKAFATFGYNEKGSPEGEAIIIYKINIIIGCDFFYFRHLYRFQINYNRPSKCLFVSTLFSIGIF